MYPLRPSIFFITSRSSSDSSLCSMLIRGGAKSIINGYFDGKIANLPVSFTLSKNVVAIYSRIEVSSLAATFNTGSGFLVYFFSKEEVRFFYSSADFILALNWSYAINFLQKNF